MAKAGYSVITGAAVPLSASTAKTALWVLAPSSFGIDLKKVRFSFDGVTASAVPVLTELCYLTGASNVTVGTGNTSTTANQAYGRTITPGVTSAYNCTTEPTVLTVLDSTLITPNGGALWYDFPLGDTWDSAVSNGFALRFTAPAGVNVRASMIFERC